MSKSPNIRVLMNPIFVIALYPFFLKGFIVCILLLLENLLMGQPVDYVEVKYYMEFIEYISPCCYGIIILDLLDYSIAEHMSLIDG